MTHILHVHDVAILLFTKGKRISNILTGYCLINVRLKYFKGKHGQSLVLKKKIDEMFQILGGRLQKKNLYVSSI